MSGKSNVSIFPDRPHSMQSYAAVNPSKLWPYKDVGQSKAQAQVAKPANANVNANPIQRLKAQGTKAFACTLWHSYIKCNNSDLCIPITNVYEYHSGGLLLVFIAEIMSRFYMFLFLNKR